jgi:hypothetical protein
VTLCSLQNIQGSKCKEDTGRGTGSTPYARLHSRQRRSQHEPQGEGQDGSLCDASPPEDPCISTGSGLEKSSPGGEWSVLHPRLPINSFALSFRNPTNPTSKKKNRIDKGTSGSHSVSGFRLEPDICLQNPTFRPIRCRVLGKCRVPEDKPDMEEWA